MRGRLEPRPFNVNARVLTDEPGFVTATAIALGVLQAKDYTTPIARLLKSGSTLDQKDACLALALMNAKETSDDIATLLTAREDYVRYYAAVALTVLDPQKYSAQTLPIVQPYHAQGYRLNKSDLHPLLSTENYPSGFRLFRRSGDLGTDTELFRSRAVEFGVCPHNLRFM